MMWKAFFPSASLWLASRFIRLRLRARFLNASLSGAYSNRHTAAWPFFSVRDSRDTPCLKRWYSRYRLKNFSASLRSFLSTSAPTASQPMFAATNRPVARPHMGSRKLRGASGSRQKSPA